MNQFLRRCLSALLAFTLFFSQLASAAEISWFTIEVKPNPMVPGEAADMTIKAVDSAGSVVTDYNGTIIMDFDGYQDTNVYDMPSNGFYPFTSSDQWIKTFSKWFVIKKSWQYVLKVYDSLLADTIVGTLPITVWDSSNTQSSNADKAIKIQEPFSWAMIEGSSINIIWLTESKKTPLQFFIDDKQVVYTWETDDSGVFSVYLTNISAGSHTLIVKMIDFEWKVIWESAAISFDYKVPVTDNFLKSFSANPDGVIQAGQTITFSATADTTVKSIEIKVWSVWTFVMDRTSDGVFSKSIPIQVWGVHKVDATLIFDGWQRTPYLDRATIDVKAPDLGVGQLKVINNAADPSKVTLSWQPIWKPSSYIVRYGLAQDKLSNEVKVSTTQVEVSGLEIGKQYFFQVLSVDELWAIVWQSSDIAMIMTQWQSVAWEQDVATTPACTVVGIKVRTEKIWENYFLVWDAIPGAVEYHIYKSEFEVKSIANMQKIATTTVPQFSYPFNIEAQKDEYTYYSVVATCSDGQNLQIDNVKKVHTWPVSDILILFFVSLMGYMLFRIYKYNY